MRSNILSGLLVIFIFSESSGQRQNYPGNLSKDEFKAITKLVKHLSLEEKVSVFTVLPTSAEPNYTLKTPANKIIDDLSFPTRKHSLRFYDLSSGSQIGQFPFPSLQTRTSSQITLPPCLAAYFKSDYLLDLPDSVTKAILWGLDTLENTTKLQPYPIQEWTTALFKHDLILISGQNSILRSILQTKLKKKIEKQLDERIIENLVTDSWSRSPTYEMSCLYKYIWKTYASNKIYQDKRFPDLSNYSEIYIYQPKNKFSDFVTGLKNYNRIQELDIHAQITRTTSNKLIIYPIEDLTSSDSVIVKSLAENSSLLLLQFNQPESRLTIDHNIFYLSIPEKNWLVQNIVAQQLSGAYDGESNPVKLLYGPPELVEINNNTLQSMDTIIHSAIKEKAFPGCQVLVAKDNVVVWNKSYGFQTYDSILPVTSQTRYDLASLTKPLATTQAIMKLVEDSLIDLDEPLSTYLGYLQKTNKASITSRQILSHQAGLYSYFPFWKKAMNELELSHINDSVQVATQLYVDRSVADSIRNWVAFSDLLADRIDTITQEQYWYSDVGFYLLQDLIETKTGKALNIFVDSILYEPLGSGLRFLPLESYVLKDIAPTEYDRILRNELVRGFVHDKNAALKGGVAGHSGLFGNANDIAIMMQLQLNRGYYGGKQYFSEEVVKEFTTRHYAHNRRGLGWDMPGPEPDGPVSLKASSLTIGHTGFTGVSIWADPKENLIFVFLSNRIYPSAENNKLIEENIRTRIQDIVYKAISNDKSDE